ncbi:MAG: hypothetical protein OI74_02765 [Gammaproteobacteria bacterium (ex Lamellibrachia satsuma)]|nr:MAG: DUF547 domain-containing protein [Gammaproteobacteria bacterium (ex Lamellibrachia satsuma)]RRS33824.1 MAG: hypothetical protein NV67_15295 [Gammaproteobacteria bacterium (ex Lamellibrachia satsuma)]RRS35215.1 MAG: hypothetical protein OI74_02765 [Gammaproteobacteria bacterium (ex Lamellibrachia satsuma)]
MLRITLFLTLLGFISGICAAPKAELWPRWQTHDETSSLLVDHAPWQDFLDSYLSQGSDGVNRVDYAGVSTAAKAELQAYLNQLQQTSVSRLNRDQQRVFWINLYNAGTVMVILNHYPVESILDIDISPGIFSNGPWGKKLFTVDDHKIALDDIEHRILRPIWRDPRLHYALNCASIGCPNLQQKAFTAINTDSLLELASRQYINHHRGVNIEDEKLTVSSIYHWFKDDFGGSDQQLLAHFRRYAEPALLTRLSKIDEIEDHHYNWRLNSAK